MTAACAADADSGLDHPTAIGTASESKAAPSTSAPTTTETSSEVAQDTAPDPDGVRPDAPMDQTPAAPLPPVASLGAPRLIQHLVTPSDADPGVDPTTNEPHYAYLDTRVQNQPQLVLYLPGADTKPSKAAPMLQEIASYGFRVVGLRYMNDFVVQDICNAHPNDLDCTGNLRREVIEGTDVSPYVNVSAADSVDTRFATTLAYLDKQNPGEGWGHYLATDGTPMWNNIIVAGHSSGSSSAVRMSKLRLLAGVMMLSGSNDNLNGVPSRWLKEPPMTPVSKIYAFSDSNDAQFPEHQRSWNALGLAGTPTNIDGAAAPFGGSHRLFTNAPGGHPEPQVGGGKFTAVWKTQLGL